MDDGSVECWDVLLSDELLGSAPRRLSGVPPLIALDLGENFDCSIDREGKALCWGPVFRDSGETYEVESVRKIESTSRLNSVAVGFDHACAVGEDNSVWCWGGNTRGELGTGDTVSSWDNGQKVIGLPSSIAIGAGVNNSCAVAETGRVFCWGTDYSSSDNKHFIFDSKRPQQIDDIQHLVAVHNGRNFVCGKMPTNSVVCWGSNIFGQLGATEEAIGGQYFGMVRRGFLGTVQDVGTGLFNACAVVDGLLDNGLVKCWGSWNDEQVFTPRTIEGISAAAKVSVNFDKACVLTKFDEIWCWGSRRTGASAKDSTVSYSQTPWKIVLQPLVQPQ